MTNEKQLNNAIALIDRVKEMLASDSPSDIIYNRLPGDVQTVDDIALIQCFYGTDLDRIKATTDAIQFNMRMTRKPSTWVFVECQKKRSECAFGWLSRYGVKYHFVQMDSSSAGIMLKNALWNLGASLCSESRLCFVDSDVVMCSSDWIEKAASAFETHDVLSLASHQYCQYDETCQLHDTIGKRLAESKSVEGSHYGFTIGMTRKVFERIGRFPSYLILCDLHLWRRIVGDEVMKPLLKWARPFKVSYEDSLGINLRVGYVENVACHVWHGDDNDKYRNIVDLLCESGVSSMSDIVDDSGVMPIWRSGSRCDVLKRVLGEYGKKVQAEKVDNPQNNDGFDIKKAYRQEMCKLLGRPDDGHPLYVCTVVKDRYGLTVDKFKEFRDDVERSFENSLSINPIVIFFTDANFPDFAELEMNVAQLSGYDSQNEFNQCLRKDLKFKTGAVVYFIPFGNTGFSNEIWVPDETIVFQDGTVLLKPVYVADKPKSKPKSKSKAKSKC